MIKNTKGSVFVPILLIFLLGISPCASAQYSTGAKRDTAALRKLESETLYRNFTPVGEVFPQKYSLRKYCPTAGKQNELPSCLAWAVVHSALTTRLAYHLKLSNQTQIDALAFSMSYIYNQMPQKCTPISFSEFKPVLQKVYWSSFFPNTPHCTPLPPEQLPHPFKVQHLEPLLLRDKSIDDCLDQIRRKLIHGYPVIVQVRSVPSLFAPQAGKWLYKYEEADTTSSDHVLCLTGYDDEQRTFELLNSWGTTWGDAGFVRIDYSLFLDAMYQEKGLLQAAFWVDLDFSKRLVDETYPLLQQLVPATSREEPFYKTISYLNYQDFKPLFTKQDKFRIFIPYNHRQTYVYMFGRDAGTKKWKIYQYQEIAAKSFGILFPSNDSLLHLTSDGTEILCCMRLKKPIDKDILINYLNQLSKKVNSDLHQEIEKYFDAKLSTFVLKVKSQ